MIVDDRNLLKNFELFLIIQYIIKNKFLCVRDLKNDPELLSKLYAKSISTLYRDLDRLVECGFLRKDSARKEGKKYSQKVYCKTSKLEIEFLSMYNQISAFINDPKAISLDFMGIIDIEILKDLISRVDLFGKQNNTTIPASNIS